jgi:hypothetical protein
LINLFIIVCCITNLAAYEWNMGGQYTFELPPLDAVTSPDGRLVYVLITDKVLVYSPTENKVVDFMPVDKEFDKLSCSAKGDMFVLTSSKMNTMKVFHREQRENIDTSGLPVKGPEKAQVTIAVFSDYQCPYCSRLDPLLQQVLDKNPRDVKLVFKNNPLSFHSMAKKAAAAALAAHDQGKFWEYHKKLFDNHGSLNDAKLQDIARELKLDLDKFNSKMKDPSVQVLINRDLAEGQRIGVNGTPTIFVNGKPLNDRSPEGFQKMINAELKK